MKNEVIQWNYDKSVKEARQNRRQRGGLDENFVRILWLARENLSREGKPVTGQTRPVTWNQYCEDIGMARRTANEWLQRYDAIKQALIPEEEFKEKKKAQKLLNPPKPKKAEVDNKLPKSGNLQKQAPTIIGGVASPNVAVGGIDIGYAGASQGIVQQTLPTAITPSAVSSDTISEEKVDSHSAQKSFTIPQEETPGSLPSDGFVLSKSLLMKLLKYDFKDVIAIKILLLVIAESYGSNPSSKYTPMLSGKFIRSAIKYPRSKDIKKDVEACKKAGFIGMYKKNELEGTASFYVKKDEKYWKAMNKNKHTDEEIASFEKIKKVYFLKLKERGVESPIFSGKEVAIIYRCIEKHTEEKIIKMLNIYIDNDEYSKFHAYTLGGFYSQLNKLQLYNEKRISKITGEEIKDVGF